ncbi:YceI family protein [Suttonella ornithocola]|uniref:YceI-like domain n=1 Tax=Suttonella ornithocola TaxID=279832 RepID=A0A380MV20_9GAMM|nr:YceI family protein [Suttonella ornithocola]SUO96429.1 Uncharacterised protein [Suttonella ornithocola]
MIKKLTLLAALSFPLIASANWQSDNAQVNFLTTKVTADKNVIIEPNHFAPSKLTLSDDGKLSGTLDLNTIQSGIDIRNERLRDWVFKTANGQLSISGQVDIEPLSKLEIGESRSIKQALTLTFGDKEATITLPLLVFKTNDARLQITSLSPALLDLSAFKVENEVNKLREVAGLLSISLQLPVTISATFTAD